MDHRKIGSEDKHTDVMNSRFKKCQCKRENIYFKMSIPTTYLRIINYAFGVN